MFCTFRDQTMVVVVSPERFHSNRNFSINCILHSLLWMRTRYLLPMVPSIFYYYWGFDCALCSWVKWDIVWLCCPIVVWFQMFSWPLLCWFLMYSFTVYFLFICGQVASWFHGFVLFCTLMLWRFWYLPGDPGFLVVDMALELLLLLSTCLVSHWTEGQTQLLGSWMNFQSWVLRMR